jgi:hypothetical protein
LRRQQASPTLVVVVPLVVRVAVVTHWYRLAAQGEPHSKPMWQQPPRVMSFGSTMQLGAGVSRTTSTLDGKIGRMTYY